MLRKVHGLWGLCSVEKWAGLRRSVAQWLRRHRDTVADETVVQHRSGLRGKIPVPPYQHFAAVADDQTKMGALVVFDSDVEVACDHGFRLCPGEGAGWLRRIISGLHI